jgi:hypothetical protein
MKDKSACALHPICVILFSLFFGKNPKDVCIPVQISVETSPVLQHRFAALKSSSLGTDNKTNGA